MRIVLGSQPSGGIMKRPRAFRRDASLCIRTPEEIKRRLTEVARKRLRDTSSCALEFITEGINRAERDLEKKLTT